MFKVHMMFLQTVMFVGVLYITIEVTNVCLSRYNRIQRKIPPWLVCGSCGACLDGVLPGVQVTVELGYFLRSSRLDVSDDSDPPVVMRRIPF